jgi:hypothetical protein
MLLAIAVPSILDAMIAELANVRWQEMARGFLKGGRSGDRLVNGDTDGTAIPRTPRAEEKWLRGRENHERVRRRKLAARAAQEKRQRGPAAGKSGMNNYCFFRGENPRSYFCCTSGSQGKGAKGRLVQCGTHEGKDRSGKLYIPSGAFVSPSHAVCSLYFAGFRSLCCVGKALGLNTNGRRVAPRENW